MVRYQPSFSDLLPAGSIRAMRLGMGVSTKEIDRDSFGGGSGVRLVPTSLVCCGGTAPVGHRVGSVEH